MDFSQVGSMLPLPILTTFLTLNTPAGQLAMQTSQSLPKSPPYISSYSTSQCPPFHSHIASTMCYSIIGGDIKYLGCGCISRPYTAEEDCESSHCLKSQHHNWICTHGYQANCDACVHVGAACASHHSCRARGGHQERFRQTTLGRCSSCHRRR
ncbi:hypothetical protein JB92DRAFT_406990 [Gautieria morchelliformis]|nr:hypothetical protein JB92DRAFT_406990 [Gautieria morchelliformis]